MTAMVAVLKLFKHTSDSELLKAVWSDSQDGHHGTKYYVFDQPKPGERFLAHLGL